MAKSKLYESLNKILMDSLNNSDSFSNDIEHSPVSSNWKNLTTGEIKLMDYKKESDRLFEHGGLEVEDRDQWRRATFAERLSKPFVKSFKLRRWI